MNGEQQASGPVIVGEDQARQELAMAAASAERSNRPKGLLAIALLLLVGAMVYAGSGVAARGATLRRVEAARREAGDVLAIAARVQGLRDKQSSRGLVADPRVGKAIEELAAAAGVKADSSGKALVVPESEVTGLAVPGVAQKEYRADVKGQDPKALLEWLVNVQSSGDTRGVEISYLTLRPETVAGIAGGPGGVSGPGTGGWSMDIKFVRWETRK